MHERPRVLFITSWYPSREWPTLGTFVREQARAAARYAEVRVLHAHPSPNGRLLPRLQVEREADLTLGLPTYRVAYPRPAPKTGYLSFVPSILWAYRKIVGGGFKPDVIHANVHETGVPAIIMARWSRVPVVISEHSSAFPLGGLSSVQIAAARWAFRRADRVLPVSEYLRNAIESYGIRAKFQVIPNAVDTRVFYPAPPQDQQRNESHRILFVGRLDREDRKGLGLLLEALVELRRTRDDWSLRVVGDGAGRSALESQTALFGLADKTEFTGVLLRSKLADVMRSSSLLVLPSRMETFGCVVMEAQACGLPVIVSAVGGVPEAVVKGGGWLVEPDNSQSLAFALSEALSTGPELGGERLASRTRFSLDEVGSQLGQIYRSVATAKLG